MRRTLIELKAIAGAIGYTVIEAAEPDCFYLLKRIDRESYIVTRLDLEPQSRTKYTLDELSRTLGLALEKFAATLAVDVRRNYQHISDVKCDKRLADVLSVVQLSSRVKKPAIDRSALDLARELHELAMDLCRRSGGGGSRTGRQLLSE